MTARRIAIIGGGPAGLMAAEQLSRAGHSVTVYEAMPTVARKFLLAGKSGLNITHAEPYECFVTRFGTAANWLRPMLDGFTPSDVRDWAEVVWAMSTRMDPARDTLLMEHTPIDYLDFASPVSGLGSKIGLDATNKWPGEVQREWGRPIVMDAAVQERAKALCEELGL